jgi:hypothetical protein
VGEGLTDRLLRHRGQPQPLDRLLDLGRVVDVGEDQLALAAGVAGVDDPVDLGVGHQLVNRPELLGGALVVGHELELVGDDREVGEAPLLQLGVVGVRLGEPDQVTDRPGDDVVVPLEVGLLLRLLVGTGQRRRQITGDGGLLGDD